MNQMTPVELSACSTERPGRFDTARKRKVRIAQVAPLAESVPPKLYGGTERVVSWLTEELVELGHEVTLFASGDSVSRAQLVPVIPRALRLSRPHGDPVSAYAILLDKLADRAAHFDVIHCHIDWLHMPVLSRLGIPFLTTLHGRLDLSAIRAVAQHFRHTALVSISNDQRTPVPDLRWTRLSHWWAGKKWNSSGKSMTITSR